MSSKIQGKTIATAIIVGCIILAVAGTVVTLTAADASGSASMSGAPSGAPSGGPPSGGAPSGGNFGGQTASASTSEATAVEVYTLETGTVQRHIRMNGDVLAESEVDVYSDVSGKIIRYSVAIGDRVTSGQRIAQVDPSKPGQSYSANPVLAPASGTISSLPNVAGDTVTSTTVMAVISDFDTLRILSSVPERYVSYITTGLSAELTFEAYDDMTFSADIVSVDPMLDSSTRSLGIELEVDDPQGLVKAGMFAEIRLVIQESVDTLVVPTEAIVSTTDGSDAVYVVGDDNVATLVPVELGLSGSSEVEILSGVDEGAVIVIKGQSFLSDGDSVNIVAGLDEE